MRKGFCSMCWLVKVMHGTNGKSLLYYSILYISDGGFADWKPRCNKTGYAAKMPVWIYKHL